MMLATDNLSGEMTGGSHSSNRSSVETEHSAFVSNLRRQPLMTHGKGDLQALEERLCMSAYRKSAKAQWPF